jgi:hypothetical protein
MDPNPVAVSCPLPFIVADKVLWGKITSVKHDKKWWRGSPRHTGGILATTFSL